MNNFNEAVSNLFSPINLSVHPLIAKWLSTLQRLLTSRFDVLLNVLYVSLGVGLLKTSKKIHCTHVHALLIFIN